MFFDKKKIRRTRTRPTFQTELLESRAMFSATEMPAVDDCPVDDIGLDIPAYEKPYGQDDSASEKGFWENVREGWKRLWGSDDLDTGICPPPSEPVEEEFHHWAAPLDEPDVEEEEEEEGEEDTKKENEK